MPQGHTGIAMKSTNTSRITACGGTVCCMNPEESGHEVG